MEGEQWKPGKDSELDARGTVEGGTVEEEEAGNWNEIKFQDTFSQD